MVSDDVVGLSRSCSCIDQGKLLEEAIFFVKEQAYYMRKAVDAGDIRDALHYGSNVISELRTSSLSPKYYYELYMKVFNELQYLADFLGDETKRGRGIGELYETVQQSSFIIPRLYLLVMTGAHYIKSKEAPAKEILNDITELCKGVQHPMRGLFLRYYLVQICKDKLPDYDSDNENGTLESFEFLINNFRESLRLWIRLDMSSSNIIDQKRKDKERLELGLLVGANLVRISQLDGLDLNFYANVALPRILEEVDNLNDNMARKYILDCLIQAFSDEFHLHTLKEILQVSISSMKSDDGIGILTNMMKRLSKFISSNTESMPVGVDIFGIFYGHLSAITVGSSGVGLRGYLDLQASFLEFTMTLFPGIGEHVELILTNTVKVLENLIMDGQFLDGRSAQSVVRLLTLPMKTLSLSCLEFGYNSSLIKLLDPRMRKNVAIAMIETLVTSSVEIDNTKSLDSFFFYTDPLFETTLDDSSEVDLESIEEEQYQISRLINSINVIDNEKQFEVYKVLRDKIVNSGPHRFVHSLPSLVFGSLKLLFRILDPEDSSATPNFSANMNPKTDPRELLICIFEFVDDLTSSLQSHIPEKSIKIMTMCAISADEVERIYSSNFGRDLRFSENMRQTCHDLIAKCCICFEDYVSNSKDELEVLCYIASAMGRIRILPKDDYNMLGMRLAKYGASLIRTTHKCAALMAMCHLFSNSHYSDEDRLLWCLKRSIDAIKSQYFVTVPARLEMLSKLREDASYFKGSKIPEIIREIDNLKQIYDAKKQ